MCGIVLGLALIHVEVNLIYAFSHTSNIFPKECLKGVLSTFLFLGICAKLRIFFWKQAFFGVVLLSYNLSLLFQFFREWQSALSYLSTKQYLLSKKFF